MMRDRYGMTLVELIVGIVIATITVAAGYAAFSSITDHSRRLNEEVSTTARAAGVRQTLMRWINESQVEIASDLPSSGLDGNVETGLNPDKDELRFITTASTPLRGPLTRVRIFVDDDPSTAAYGLTAALQASSGDDSLRIQLDSTVTHLVLDFLAEDQNGRQWVRIPDSLSVTLAVRMVLTSGDVNVRGGLHPILSVPLVVPLAESVTQ